MRGDATFGGKSRVWARRQPRNHVIPLEGRNDGIHRGGTRGLVTFCIVVLASFIFHLRQAVSSSVHRNIS
jgi:hypothetical protein